MIELGVRAIMRDKIGGILMVQNHHGIHENRWVLPGGRVEEGESSEDAIRREVREELGLEFEPEFFTYCEDLTSREDTHFIALFFIGSFTGNTSLQPDEILSYKFFSWSDIKEADSIGFGHKEVLLHNQQKIVSIG